MKKQLYFLKINPALQSVMPPLQNNEMELLTQSLLEEGCREPLVIWNGMLVDGHNRYRICHEYDIPFAVVEMEFSDLGAAITWSIRNQIARRNLTPFQRCEMVLPFEAELKAEAKKRQGWRGPSHHIKDDSTFGRKTRDILADMAGVSHGTFSHAKAILVKADTETLRRLRRGEISINGAYISLYSTSARKTKPDGRVIQYIETHGDMKSTNDASVDRALLPIEDAVKELLNRVTEGEATTKMIIRELNQVTRMIEKVRNDA